MPYADREVAKAYHRAYIKQWNMRNREEIKAYCRAYHRKRYSDPEFRRQMKNRTLVNTFGITVDQYEQMRIDQGNKCSICENDFTRNPHIDHDHTTGKIRALLCGQCNKGLGMFRDKAEVLVKAAEYIKRFQ